MADRIMFSKTVIESDMFLSMPLSSQALYFHLAMRADDDGFVNSPKNTQRVIGAKDNDFKSLIARRFILHFESGIVVIKHWRMHNNFEEDGYIPTIYQEENAQLTQDENMVYLLNIS